MDHRGSGGGGGGGGGNSNRTDLLIAGRKKLQQFRKKKEKRGPGKKAKADAGAEEEAAKAEESAPEPKSPVGLKLLAGEGGSSGSTPFEEVERSQVEQCNGEEPGTMEPSPVENADVVHVQDTSDGGDAYDLDASKQGISEHEGFGPAGAEEEAEESVPEPKSPVGLKLLTGEGGSSGSTPFEEAERSQVEQCNGEEPGTMKPNPVENADVVHVQETGDGGDAHDLDASKHGTSEHEGSGPAGAEEEAEESVPEPKSPGGLKLLTGEGGCSGTTPFEEAERSQVEQCNAEEPGTMEPSPVENADVVHVQETGDGDDARDLDASKHGTSEHEGSGPAGAEEEVEKAEESVPEPKSLVGLKLLAGEGGSSGSTPFEEVERSQVEQCNGEEPGTMEPSPVENADVVHVQETGDGGDAYDLDASKQGISEHEGFGPAGAEEAAKAGESVPELKSPVVLKLLAREGGSGGSTPFEEAERSQVEQCNSEELGTMEPSPDENADVVHIQETGDGGDARDLDASKHGTSEHEGSRPAGAEDPAIQATGEDVTSDAVEGTQESATNVSEELLDCSSKENMELQTPQDDEADSYCSQPKECSQPEVETNSVERATSLDSKEVSEVPVPSDDITVDKGNEEEESRAAVTDVLATDLKLSSVKEKLSIAVAKGKSLIVQRDNLKHSLLEKSAEVEKLTQDLHSKEALLKELEAKLKSYTEADRIEALESELSYIRSSAIALRDSFLQKDSVLQRIEEVLEDLELPEQFHSQDIVEKIELLSNMVVSTSFTQPDGDKRSSVDQQSESGVVVDGHSESGVAVDSITYEYNSISNNFSDEAKSRYDELHRRFYELAEHNNMLEQSLVERNNLIQKWEEVLGQISMPPQFRMLEAEDKISWLGKRLLEVEHERDSLQLKIEHLEDSSEMLIGDLEGSHKRISELSAEVIAIKAEKDFFSQSFEKLRFEFLGLSEKAIQDDIVRDNLRKELSQLQEKLAEKSEESKHYRDVDTEIQKLLNLMQHTLQDGNNYDYEVPSGASSAMLFLGELLRKLLDDYRTLLSKSTSETIAKKEIHLEETKSSNNASSSDTDTSIHDKETEVSTLNNESDHADQCLALVEQQRDEAVEKVQSLMLEIKTLHAEINKLQESSAEQMQKYQSLLLELESEAKLRHNLQEQLSQEEQKCASLREKLNIAVRKGKGLVQHRDNLKQTMEEMNIVIEKLTDEKKTHIESLETEKSSLLGRLAENEKNLHDTNRQLSGLLNALNEVDVAREFDMDPITKVKKIAKLYLELQAIVTSSQNEVKKSKRATELLLAELNEAHERADNLQEELVKAQAAVSESSKQYNIMESAKEDAIRQLEHIIHIQTQTNKKQIGHLIELNSRSTQLRETCFELSLYLVNAFSKDNDLISHMEGFMKCANRWMEGATMVNMPIAFKHVLSDTINHKKAHTLIDPLEIKMSDTDERQILHHLATTCHVLSNCLKDCNDLKRTIDEHGFSVEQKATELFDIMFNLQNRFISQHSELESLREKVIGLQSEMEHKDEEIVSMHRNLSSLYEACTSAVIGIEGMSDIYYGNQSYGVEHSAFDIIKSIIDQLVAFVKTYENSNEGSAKELKGIVHELQQELQDKDVQINTISLELSSQIRKGESYAKELSIELEDARMKIRDLHKQVNVLHDQKIFLETQLNDLEDIKSVASEQHERIKELTDELSRKDQEIEGLIQALDEEEKEFKILENKSNYLEQQMQEKEFALKSLDVSRTKALVKLATTVGKFDELHSLFESLLAEVENLQNQLQERDLEISFLRQEVTRSTNELLTTEESNKKYSSQINECIKWLETILVQFGVHYESTDDCDCTQVPTYMDMLYKKIGSLISESDDLRITVQNKDSLLQIERAKMEELLHKSEALEASLRKKDSQIGLLCQDRSFSQPSRSAYLPDTSEIEHINDKASPAAAMTQIRGARRANNNQVAIDVEMEDKPLDEDDDKAHGFKSLTMSHFVPKFTRPISDKIDGMWVSGDRLLMRQPTLRLGVLIYWITLHALLASFI